MKVRKRPALAAVAASLLMLTIAAPAHAADFTIYSTSYRSSVYYNDSNNTLRLCDVVDRDGDGAYLDTSLGHGAIVYNGCTWVQNIPDGVQMRVGVCDWMIVSSNRNPWNCRDVTVAL
ncbi:hypothetical protein [Nocardioides sp. Soil805]|uniref:hypothetical protein n=1 Tax=Nocardioides sp. Soil805 TaxID=1736416 RepID=UPI0007029A06|nr:hypothetical protein [Nocardioides sp. Soil805]KRF34688.1 hypothetical protein ASG94_10950 [Nocardioides sp. Soil805]